MRSASNLKILPSLKFMGKRCFIYKTTVRFILQGFVYPVNKSPFFPPEYECCAPLLEIDEVPLTAVIIFLMFLIFQDVLLISFQFLHQWHKFFKLILPCWLLSATARIFSYTLLPGIGRLASLNRSWSSQSQTYPLLWISVPLNTSFTSPSSSQEMVVVLFPTLDRKDYLQVFISLYLVVY